MIVQITLLFKKIGMFAVQFGSVLRLKIIWIVR